MACSLLVVAATQRVFRVCVCVCVCVCVITAPLTLQTLPSAVLILKTRYLGKIFAYVVIA